MFLELLLYRMMQVQGLCNDPGEDLVPEASVNTRALPLYIALMNGEFKTDRTGFVQSPVSSSSKASAAELMFPDQE